MSYNWNKEGQDALAHRLAGELGDCKQIIYGPLTFVALRFFLVVLLWLAIFPSSIRGWSRFTLARGFVTGGLFASAVLVQQIGLVTASESVGAFLTSTFVLITPFLEAVFLKNPVSKSKWLAGLVAISGVALLTLRDRYDGPTVGALLCLLSAFLFSGHILATHCLGKLEDPWRFPLVQFLTCAVAFTILESVCVGRFAWRLAQALPQAVSATDVAVPLILMVILGSIIAYGMMFRFQPRISPTRASLIYSSEAIFATLYAGLIVGWTLGAAEVLGCVMIGSATIGSQVLERYSGEKAD